MPNVQRQAQAGRTSWQVLSLVQVMFHKKNCVIGILQNREATFHEMRHHSCNLAVLLGALNQNGQHASNNVKQHWGHGFTLP